MILYTLCAQGRYFKVKLNTLGLESNYMNSNVSENQQEGLKSEMFCFFVKYSQTCLMRSVMGESDEVSHGRKLS